MPATQHNASRTPKQNRIDLVAKLSKQQALDALFLDIAKRNFNVETLATRRHDGLDFHDTAVWSMKQAIQEAYEAGLKAGKNV